MGNSPRWRGKRPALPWRSLPPLVRRPWSWATFSQSCRGFSFSTEGCHTSIPSKGTVSSSFSTRPGLRFPPDGPVPQCPRPHGAGPPPLWETALPAGSRQDGRWRSEHRTPPGYGRTTPFSPAPGQCGPAQAFGTIGFLRTSAKVRGYPRALTLSTIFRIRAIRPTRVQAMAWSRGWLSGSKW